MNKMLLLQFQTTAL